MRSFLAVVLSTVIWLGSSSTCHAQCAPIPGTGCPGQNAPVCGGVPMIGTSFGVRCAPSCFPSVSQIMIVGTPLATPLPLPSPPMCVAGCLLGCQPIVFLSLPSATFTVPNNPALIGLRLCIQCLCQPTGAVCFNITQATAITIT
jgi:hypothetical protein